VLLDVVLELRNLFLRDLDMLLMLDNLEQAKLSALAGLELPFEPVSLSLQPLVKVYGLFHSARPARTAAAVCGIPADIEQLRRSKSVLWARMAAFHSMVEYRPNG
jgi:hypothetical protein